MFPLKDDIPSDKPPVVTVLLIVVNILVFLFEMSLGSGVQRFVTEYGVVPARFAESMGSQFPTLFTSMFLHGGWSHVLGNMLYLWIFGDNVEDRVGHGRFIIFYLLCGFAAGGGQILMNPGSMIPTIGASGAIAGIMGAYFVLYPHSRVLTFIPFPLFNIVEVPAIFLLGFWFLMQLFNAGTVAVTAGTSGGGVAFAAHIVGFVFGVGGIFLFRKREPRQQWEL